MKYYQPSFSSFKPIKLQEVVNKIIQNNETLKYNLTNNKLKEIIIKIINNNNVTSLDIEIIIFNFEKVIVLISKDKLNTFFEILKKYLKRIKTLKEKLILRLIYDKLVIFYSREKKYLILLRQIGNIILYRKNHHFLERYFNFFKYNGYFIDFLEEEFNIFFNKEIYFNKKIDYKQFCNLYKISFTSKIFQDLIKLFFSKNINDLIYKEESINDKLIILFKFNVINIDERKNIYNKIFYIYTKDQILVKNYSKTWFRFIKNDLKNPNDFIENWYNIKENYINMMKRWLIEEKLEEVFEGKDNYNKERLNFWKEYSHYLKDIIFYEDLNKAIIMKTDKHIFVEFGEIGNAFFIYNNNEENLKKIDKIKNYTNRAATIDLLKNLSDFKKKLSHSGHWYFKFKEVLDNLGYIGEK